jgi:predicted TPR repeat methyltransferase
MQNQDDADRKQAEQYDEEALATGWQGPALVFQLASRSIEPGQTILDIGIGTGLGSERLAQAGLHVYGMDISDDMLEICRKKGFTAGLVCHDLTIVPYPFSDASFNHVVSTGVFQFFSDLDRVFGEVQRVLPGGGMFIFITGDRRPGEPSEVVVGPEQSGIGVPVTMFRHTREQIEGWLAKNGFRFVDSVEFRMYMNRERQETFPVQAYLAQKVDEGTDPMLPVSPRNTEALYPHRCRDNHGRMIHK